MLQKLENAYLMILRIVVIAGAGLLLLAVGILGVDSFKALQSEPDGGKQTPQVSSQAIVEALTTKKPAETPPAANESTHTAVDPNDTDYQRVATAIANFVARHSEGTAEVNKDRVIQIVKERARQQGSAELAAAFARNLADTMEKILADPAIVNLAANSSTLEVVNTALNRFTEEFARQKQKGEAELAVKQARFLERRAQGMQSLYLAAASFGAFLLIVFLSIFIRIERNLRNLERWPANAA